MTTTAFVGLPSVSQARQHRRTVTKLEGSLTSEADNGNQVVIAIADAMAALHAPHAKCKILHGNISDRAILLQKAADGIKGVLADFDYVSIDGDSVAEAPELKLFQSIHSLRNPGAACSPLEDAESLLYLVCWLRTFGINRAQRAGFVAGRILPILGWNEGTAVQIANQKRSHMSSDIAFHTFILRFMRPGPLHDLALDMYRVLFLHPGTFGTLQIDDEALATMENDNILAALLALPVTNGWRDLLALRNRFVNEIIRNILEIVAWHRDTALAILNSGMVSTAPMAATRPSAGPSLKHYGDEVPLAEPSKRPRH
ncbi:hypothetical protein IWW39_000481 [Coemansia spiralis]|uniref:Fungal-type protein kinase domain-containing protein n=1 Tax=Coemansia spiralis TaxID=417178 RepID=A0A9W8L6F0_9FUNG|nr:hypothetical protein IWW39_000481 [Coemansia spiralis]